MSAFWEHALTRSTWRPTSRTSSPALNPARTWHLTVKLDRIEPPDAKLKAPRILESHGSAPKQYPDWDD
jgi:hypothetical protein